MKALAALLAALLGLLAPSIPATRAEEGGGRPQFPERKATLRLLAPGLFPTPQAAEGLALLALKSALKEAAIEAFPAPPQGLGAEALQGVDAILLDPEAAAALAPLGETAIEAIVAAVRRGAGLVVTGSAGSLFSTSEALASLLGEKAAPLTRAPALLAGPLIVEITDQSHALTQCLTHLRPAQLAASEGRKPRGGEVLAQARPDTRGEARALPAPPAPPATRGEARDFPALWVRRLEQGRVAHLSLSLSPGEKAAPGGEPTSPAARGGQEARKHEASLLAFLTARAVEWAAGRPISVRIPGDLPLFAEHLLEGHLLEGTAALLDPHPPTPGFYRGRQIAPVMGFEAADWLLRPDREASEKPEEVIEALAIPPGATVADLGAGAGYFSLRLARRVGAAGRVLAIDLQEEMLRLLRERMARDGVRNIEPVLATEADPRLPEGSVDLVLMVDVYHELAQPAVVLAAVKRSLKEARDGNGAGRLVLVEYRGEDPAVPIKPLHRMTVQQARAEVEPLGFRWLETKGFLSHQHILIFARR